MPNHVTFLLVSSLELIWQQNYKEFCNRMLLAKVAINITKISVEKSCYSKYFRSKAKLEQMLINTLN